MSIQILYKGFNRPISSQEAITLLTQLLKGDRAKAEDAFMAGTCLNRWSRKVSCSFCYHAMKRPV
jgi:hypothetical protein